MRFLSGVLAVSFVLASVPAMAETTEIELLNEAQAVGSPFTRKLTEEYRHYVSLKRKWLDYDDAKHFAKKALMAAEGQNVLPEPLENWRLDNYAASKLLEGRLALLSALDGGGRAMAPYEAAIAQSRFDCWVEQSELNNFYTVPPTCREDFRSAMKALSARMIKTLPRSSREGRPIPEVKKPKPAPAPMPEPELAPMVEEDPNAIGMSMDEGMFLAFFDFNKSDISGNGGEVISAIADQAKKRNDLRSIRVVGHADTSGGDKYNEKLSLKRAESVKSALIERGVSAALLQTSGVGEAAPMVKTANNTREPANRRVEVTFE